MRRALTVLALGLCAVPAAEAAGPRYRFVAETKSTTTVTSTCTAREGGAGTTETFVWALESRQAGTSAIGRGTRREPKGAWKLTGTIRRESTRRVEGAEPGAPQGGTEPLQEREGTTGLLYRLGKRLELRLSHGGLLDPVFGPLARGKSTTIVQDPEAREFTSEQTTTEGGACTDRERTEIVRRIVVTRLR